jgi:hypothetical protein
VNGNTGERGAYYFIRQWMYDEESKQWYSVLAETSGLQGHPGGWLCHLGYNPL